MSKVILFSGNETLHSLETRAAMLRIPEVSARLRSAQPYMDALSSRAPLLVSYMLVENEWFDRESELQSILVALVQLGLLDRFTKTNQLPKYFIGPRGNDSVLKLVNGASGIGDWLINTSWSQKQRALQNESAQPIHHSHVLPIGASAASGASLSRGISQTELELISVHSQDGVMRSESLLTSADVCQMIRHLSEKEGVNQIINVGPSHALTDRIQGSPLRETLRIVDSIELDPLLTWFTQRHAAHSSFYFRG